MREKVQVVVSPNEVESYLARGYVRSDIGAELLLGANVWGLLSHEEREGLVVVEVDAKQHLQLNDTHLRMCRMYVDDYVTVPGKVCVASVRVLETLPENGAIVAREDKDAVPEECGRHELFETVRACLDENREFMLLKIRQLRQAADRMETLLKHTERL
jgi:hypothetical protein